MLIDHDRSWSGKGMAVTGGKIWAIDEGVHLYCVRHSRFNRPGCWSVDWQAPGFYVMNEAVVDDFGNLVRVGVPS